MGGKNMKRLKEWHVTLMFVGFWAIGILQATYIPEEWKTLFAVFVGLLAAACSHFIFYNKEE